MSDEGKRGRRGRVRTITVENAAFQVLAALKTNRRKRAERKEIFVEGVSAIDAAIASGLRVRSAAFSSSRPLSGWAKEVLECTDPEEVLALSEPLMRSLSDRTDPSELLITVERPALGLGDLSFPSDPLIVVMDRPSNHGNLGAILRSANAFGVDAFVTTGHGVDPYDPAVIRASRGAIFLTPALHEQSAGKLEQWIFGLKVSRPALRVIGTDSGGSVPLASFAPARPLLVFLGNEAEGMSFRFRELVDAMVSIPMHGAVDSLNVACAASIVLYEIGRNAPEPGATPG